MPTVETVRLDLERAGIAREESEHTLDFHALRTTTERLASSLVEWFIEGLG